MKNTDNTDFEYEVKLLEKWCSDCTYRNENKGFLGDPCHHCLDDFSDNNFIPKYYEQE